MDVYTMGKFMIFLRTFTLTFLVFISSAVQCVEVTSSVNSVNLFIKAFNSQNSHDMAKLVADDIEWLSISGDKVMVESKGKDNLVASMNAYFTSCPTCRSKLSSVASTGNRISAVETASWQGKNGIQSQKAISVYEFSNGLINRVYYFSAE